MVARSAASTDAGPRPHSPVTSDAPLRIPPLVCPAPRGRAGRARGASIFGRLPHPVAARPGPGRAIFFSSGSVLHSVR